METNAGVIWISGFSASGKTTVGRKVESLLQQKGIPTVFLDGDDLRSILGAKWGYERDERIELARVYFRLASHLSAQGITVIVCAVAMYTEVRAWVRENVPGSLQVYLHVPVEERIRRDKITKAIYSQLGDMSLMYDPPDDQSLNLDNYGTTTPDEVAASIAEAFHSRGDRGANFGRIGHWGDFYSRNIAPTVPSPFCADVAAGLQPGRNILEIGCGNGRDAGYFARNGHNILGIDPSAAAIETCQKSIPNGQFLCGTVDVLGAQYLSTFDVVYSRFVIHAMPLREEERLLDEISTLIKPGGQLFIECRSINDPFARLGEVISPTERIYGHYRRFLILDELVERLRRRNFVIEKAVESNGLAIYKDEDPVVIRITARAQSAP